MQSEHYGQYLNMMNQWLILSQEGKNISSFLRKNHWNSAAVYGMAIYGRHVIRELKRADYKIMYGIDRRENKEYGGVQILRPEDKLPQVDIIINSVIHQHNIIVNDLKKVTPCPVISLEHIIFESY